VRFTQQVWPLRKSTGNPLLRLLPAVFTASKAKIRFPSIHRLYALARIYRRTVNELLSLYGIPLVEHLRGWLRTWRPNRLGLVFATSNGTPWDADVVRKRKLYPLLEQLGIKKCGFHAFRHGNETVMDSEAVPMATQSRLGHSDPRTTMRYTHTVSEDGKKIAARFGELLTSSQTAMIVTRKRVYRFPIHCSPRSPRDRNQGHHSGSPIPRNRSAKRRSGVCPVRGQSLKTSTCGTASLIVQDPRKRHRTGGVP
jgi:Phage integrase family